MQNLSTLVYSFPSDKKITNRLKALLCLKKDLPESGVEPLTYALRMLKFNLTINKNNYLYCTLIL